MAQPIASSTARHSVWKQNQGHGRISPELDRPVDKIIQQVNKTHVIKIIAEHLIYMFNLCGFEWNVSIQAVHNNWNLYSLQ